MVAGPPAKIKLQGMQTGKEKEVMRKKLKRLLSLVMVFSMTMSLLSTTASAATAAETQKTKQITNVGGVNPDSGLNADGVSVSKTIAATGVENYFDITLKATTTETSQSFLKEKPIDVVIVMDLSNTMIDYEISDGKTRYAAALEAANAFIDKFQSKSASVSVGRRIGIVGFNTNGKKISGLTTVKTKAQATALKNTLKTKADEVMNSYDSSKKSTWETRWTNMEAGLLYANNLLKSSTANKYVIFISDGYPTTYLDTSTTDKT